LGGGESKVSGGAEIPTSYKLTEAGVIPDDWEAAGAGLKPAPSVPDMGMYLLPERR
jgi:hypothetical protein